MVSIESLTHNGFDLHKCAALMSISVKSFSLGLLQEKVKQLHKLDAEQFVRPVN